MPHVMLAVQQVVSQTSPFPTQAAHCIAVAAPQAAVQHHNERAPLNMLDLQAVPADN